jgi:hypothetical protein
MAASNQSSASSPRRRSNTARITPSAVPLSPILHPRRMQCTRVTAAATEEQLLGDAFGGLSSGYGCVARRAEHGAAAADAYRFPKQLSRAHQLGHGPPAVLNRFASTTRALG